MNYNYNRYFYFNIQFRQKNVVYRKTKNEYVIYAFGKMIYEVRHIKSSILSCEHWEFYKLLTTNNLKIFVILKNCAHVFLNIYMNKWLTYLSWEWHEIILWIRIIFLSYTPLKKNFLQKLSSSYKQECV